MTTKGERPSEDIEAMKREASALADEISRICQNHSSRAIMAALTEMYGRVLSVCCKDERDVEKWLMFHMKHARTWWLADHGGPTRIQ